MQIVVCDPGLNAVGSHHFHWLTSVAENFLGLGLGVKIYGCVRAEMDVQKQIGAIAHFAHSTYDKHNFGPGDEELNWRIGNESFRKDLTLLDFEIARADALVIFPAVTQNQLDGLARWYDALRPDSRPKIAVSLMFHPQWTPWGDRAIRGPEYYATAIDRLRPWVNHSVYLYAENPEAKAYYEELTAVSIEVAPIPWKPVDRVASSRMSGPIRFGYFGHARAEKGFHLLPTAVDICRSQGLPFDLIAQINHNGFEATTNRAEQALRSKPGVSPIIGPMDSEQYHRVLDFCDVILLPYDPGMYRFRGSGLFAEAVAYGKPVIVSAGTAMENAAKRGECAALVCEFNSAALARAMCEAASRRGELEVQAKIAARRWSEANNVSVYCHQLLAFAQANGGAQLATNLSCGENEDLRPWPSVRAERSSTMLASPTPVQASRRIEFIPHGLHSSRGLAIDVGLVPNSGKVEAVAVSLELNGHGLGSVTVKGGRRVHVIGGPFPFLKDGLPTTLKVGVGGEEGDTIAAVPQVYGIRFLPPAWHRRLFARAVGTT